MIDVPQTREALERAADPRIPLNGNDCALLRALSAALGQAQEAWQNEYDIRLLAFRDPTYLYPGVIGWRKVLILPADATDKEVTK